MAISQRNIFDIIAVYFKNFEGISLIIAIVIYDREIIQIIF